MPEIQNNKQNTKYITNKNTLSVTNQPVAADYETPVKSSGLEMKDNMVYGHVSVTTSTGTPAVVYESVQSWTSIANGVNVFTFSLNKYSSFFYHIVLVIFVFLSKDCFAEGMVHQ